MDIPSLIPLIGEQLQDIDGMGEELVQLTVAIAQIPAPTFEEDERGAFIMKKFLEMGYATAKDNVGNILATVLKEGAECIIVCAHLDTVFPKTVDHRVKRENERLYGPGVGDNSRGLAVLLSLAKLMRNMDTKRQIVFVANVGEEGIGDLRGMKHLFFDPEHYRLIARTRYFLAIDSVGTETIINKSIGSRRYEIEIGGKGGHSFKDFGMSNPIYAIADFISQFKDIEVPETPRTTFNIGKIEGGMSVNAIPDRVKCQVDLRSASKEQLKRLEEHMIWLAENAVEKEQKVRTNGLKLNIKKIGDRPAGECHADNELVQLAVEVTRYFGIEPVLGSSSTDANIPQSLGIPAITVAGTHKGDGAHSLEEWIEIGKESLLPLKRNFLLLCALAEVQVSGDS